MSENKKEVEIVEKKGLGAAVKARASAFGAKHEKGVKMVKTGVEVLGAFTLGVLAKCGWDALTGRKNDDSFVVNVETEVQDEQIEDEVNDDNN